MHYQYLNSRVYQTIVTDDRKEAGAHIRQVNNTMTVIGTITAREHEKSFNELKAMFEDYYKDSDRPVKVMACYPYKEELQDTKMDYTFVHGYMVEWKKHDPNEPYIVPGDATDEEKEALLKERLMPYPVISPFALLFPETPQLMFDIILSYTPETGIIYLDKEHDINTELGQMAKEEEMEKSVTPNILFDPSLHLTPEDREAFMQKVIEMEQERLKNEGEASISAPEDIDTPELPKE